MQMFLNAQKKTRSTTHQASTLLAAAVAAVALPSAAFAGLSFTGANLTEDFNTLQSSGSNSTNFSTTSGVQNTIPGLTTWDGVKLSGTSTGSLNFAADNGGNASGG